MKVTSSVRAGNKTEAKTHTGMESAGKVVLMAGCHSGL